MNDAPDWPAMLDRAARLLKAAAPELAGVPLYLVAQSGTAFAGSCLSAFTHPNLDVWIKGRLAGRWRGRGWAVVLNDTAAGIPSEVPACMLADHVAAAAVHEVGHGFADGYDLAAAGSEPGEDALKAGREITPLAAARMADRGAPTDRAIVGEFMAHGERWIRAVLHLRRRIEAAGVYLPASTCVGVRSELSRPEAYDAALADEPERTAGRPLAEILDSPAPAAFAELWERDRAEFASIFEEPAATGTPPTV